MKPQRMANWPPLKSCCSRCLASLLSFGMPAAGEREEEEEEEPGRDRHSAPPGRPGRGRLGPPRPAVGAPLAGEGVRRAVGGYFIYLSIYFIPAALRFVLRGGWEVASGQGDVKGAARPIPLRGHCVVPGTWGLQGRRG